MSRAPAPRRPDARAVEDAQQFVGLELPLDATRVAVRRFHDDVPARAQGVGHPEDAALFDGVENRRSLIV